MAENSASTKKISIGKVGGGLAELVQSQMPSYVLTQAGVPKAVLLDYDEYQSLIHAVDLLNRPDVISNIVHGLTEIQENKRIPLEFLERQVTELKMLEDAKAAKRGAQRALDGLDVSIVRNRTLAPRSTPTGIDRQSLDQGVSASGSVHAGNPTELSEG